MALSGSWYVNVGSHWRLQMQWSASQSQSGNYSNVTARLYWIARDSYGAVNSSATKTAAIQYNNGSWHKRSAAGLARLSGNQKKQVHSRTFRINHRSDGTASFSLDGYFDAEVTLSGVKYNRINLPQRSFTLNTIPRKSTMTSSRNWTAGSNRTITISRASTSFNHKVFIDVKTRGGSWKNIKSINMSRGTTSVSTSFSVAEHKRIFEILDGRSSTQTRMNLRTYNGSDYLGYNGYYGTVSAPRANTTNWEDPELGRDFYIGNTISGGITRRNSRFRSTIQLIFGGSTYTLHDKTSSTSWSYDTSNIANSLYDKMSSTNRIEGKIRILTYYEGVRVAGQGQSDLDAVIRPGSMDPTFSGSFTYQDRNSSTTAITNDNQVIVQGQSDLIVNIPSSSSASPSRGTSMSHYNVTVDGVTKRADFKTSNISIPFGSVSSESNTLLYVEAVDERGNKSIKSKGIAVIPYEPIRLNFLAKRKNYFETTTDLTINGTASTLKVGSTNKNSVEKVEYRVAEHPNGNYGSWKAVSISGFPRFQAGDLSEELDNTKSFKIEVRAVDKLSTTTSTSIVEVGRPIMFWDPNLESAGFRDYPKNAQEFLMNATLRFGSEFWNDTGGIGEGIPAIDLNNSDVVGTNSIWFNDVSQSNNGEGFLFPTSNTPSGSTDASEYDNLLVRDGIGYLNGYEAFTSMKLEWTGAVYPNEKTDIPISRSLNECIFGWILVWSDYDVGGSYANDFNWVFHFIPRKFSQYDNGGSALFTVARHNAVRPNDLWTVKELYVNAKSLRGSSRNSSSEDYGNDVVLRRVYSL